MRINTLLLGILVLFSCKQPEKKLSPDTTISGNISETISADTALLGKLIDLSTYRPSAVKFKYRFIDNSGQKKRISVPGPSDSYLEAVLFFEQAVLESIKLKCPVDDSIQYQMGTFRFGWDKETQNKLLKADSNFKSRPDRLFHSGVNGRIWVLDDRILLEKST